MLRTLTIAGTMLCAWHATAEGYAAFTNGNDLQRLCNSAIPYETAACTYYVIGAFDMMSSTGSHADRICVPEGVRGSQLKAVVTNWLRDHPEKWHWTAAYIVEKALQENFPCVR